MTSLLMTLTAVVTSTMAAAGAIELAACSGLTNDNRSIDRTQGAEHPHGWSSEFSLAEGVLTLEVDDMTLLFRGDPGDPGQILIDLSEPEQRIVYRLWPDIAKWQLSEEGRRVYSKEFEDIPGWRERTIRVCVDAIQSQRRVWVDQRLVKSWQSSSDLPRLLVAGRKEEIVLKGHSDQGEVGPCLELPLGPYFNDGPATPYAPDASVDLGNGMALRYGSNPTASHNLDLGKLTYRVTHMPTGSLQPLSMPYVNCNAMSSDPQRAIFRVPARFYDQLHLLCYDDGDEGEVPRAAVRLMKAEARRGASYVVRRVTKIRADR